jgi:methyl-accepting chemotaxis protein
MKNWTIKKRIIAGFTILVLLSTIMGILAWNSMRTIGTHADEVANKNVPGLALGGGIMQNLAMAHLVLVRHVLTTNVDEKRADEATLKEIGETITKLAGNLEAVCTSQEEKTALEKTKQARQNYLVTRESILQLSNAGKSEEAKSLLLTSGRAAYSAYDTLSTELNTLETKGATDGAEIVLHNARASQIMLITVVVGELIISVLLGMFVVIGLNRALRKVSESLDEGAEQVTAASGQVSASSQSLAEGASEQAASLEETSSSLEEMSSMTKRNAENAQKANDLAKQTRAAADTGVGDMQQMSAAMDAIKVSSNDIAKIIKTIDEIAFQTNILALNAAVEAARAGEAGMGFAVVADEVRNLAQRSAQAAKETAAKIEGAIGKSAQGVEISNKVAQRLNEIVTKIRQVDELVAEVAGASREQTQGITQINIAVGQMDKVTQSNAASAEESAAASEELNAQAVAMKESVTELLLLVGGNNRNTVTKTFTTKTADRPLHTKAPHQAAPAKKQSAPIHGNGNGNGHSHAELATAGKINGRSEIPLEGDFKNF